MSFKEMRTIPPSYVSVKTIKESKMKKMDKESVVVVFCTNKLHGILFFPGTCVKFRSPYPLVINDV